MGQIGALCSSTLSAEASTKAGDLACAAMTRGNLGELLTNQGRTDEAVAILGPAARTLESVGWTVMTAGTEAELGRALAFHGDCEGGLVLLRSAVVVLDEIGAHYEALEAYSRLADILVFDNRPTEARSALAWARELERVLGETQLAPHIDRLELILAATHNGGMSPTAVESFLERARRIGATYDELVVLALAERLGDQTQHEHVALARALVWFGCLCSSMCDHRMSRMSTRPTQSSVI